MDYLDYLDILCRLTINDQRLGEDIVSSHGSMVDTTLDHKTLALVRLAALVAVQGAVPSYCAQADAAVSAGATPAEIVDVLIAVAPVVGLPHVVAAAPSLALALGHDTDDPLG